MTSPVVFSPPCPTAAMTPPSRISTSARGGSSRPASSIQSTRSAFFKRISTRCLPAPVSVRQHEAPPERAKDTATCGGEFSRRAAPCQRLPPRCAFHPPPLAPLAVTISFPPHPTAPGGMAPPLVLFLAQNISGGEPQAGGAEPPPLTGSQGEPPPLAVQAPLPLSASYAALAVQAPLPLSASYAALAVQAPLPLSARALQNALRLLVVASTTARVHQFRKAKLATPPNF